MATMEDVAKAAHVSRATVSRVLSNHPSVKLETRNQVMYWVRQLGYEPNQIAQSLAGNRTNIIGVLFSDLSNPLYAALMTAITHEAERAGFSVLLGDAQREKAREARIIGDFKRRRIEGLIVRPIGSPNLKLYRGLSMPVVSLFKLTHRLNIIVSSEDGGIQVARHFCALGHRHIGYMGPLRSSVGNDKFDGFQLELSKHGLRPEAVLDIDQKQPLINQNAYDRICRYLDEHDPGRITAWFAHNDTVASDIIRALTERGVQVPRDAIVCGYNDTLLARKIIPTLSSVASPVQEMAANAVDMIVNALADPDLEQTISLAPRLIIRESTSRKL